MTEAIQLFRLAKTSFLQITWSIMKVRHFRIGFNVSKLTNRAESSTVQTDYYDFFLLVNSYPSFPGAQTIRELFCDDKKCG